MRDLFAAYWWLLFPLAFFLAAMWRNWLAFLTRRQELEIEHLKAVRLRRGESQVKDGSGMAGA
ncbi:MAG TPA: hypothetical protein VG407_12115 [Caulobacteraceae bacterium]|jgi:hypothetical protein|nr:hypothetical protein [Caulobacteraceae bacterium]